MESIVIIITLSITASCGLPLDWPCYWLFSLLVLWISEILFDYTRDDSILTRRNKILLLSSVLLITACEFSESVPSYLSLRLLWNLSLLLSELFFLTARVTIVF